LNLALEQGLFPKTAMLNPAETLDFAHEWSYHDVNLFGMTMLEIFEKLENL